MRVSIAAAVAFSVAAFVAASSVLGQDFPKRKSGLWQIQTSSSNAGRAAGQAHTADVQMCIDEKTDNAVQQQAAGMTKQNCSKQDIKKSGGQIVVDSVCKFGQTTATTHSVFTGSFDSSYKVETKSTYDPPLMGMKEGGATIEARWLGPCKPDQRPGDMILGNGMKINMNDVKGGPPHR
jgi:hypothetical protein